jgi:peptidoglycan/LPS O-acetylase OafA/YrhL
MWAAFVVCYVAVADSLPRLFSRALCWVGSLTYSTYLWHFLLVSVMVNRGIFRRISEDPYRNAILNTVLILLPVTLLVSWMSHRAIERPFFALRVRYLRPLEPPRAMTDA